MFPIAAMWRFIQITCRIKKRELNAVPSGNRRIGIIIGLCFLPSQKCRRLVVAAQVESEPIPQQRYWHADWIFVARTMLSSHASPEGMENILRPLAAILRRYRVLLRAVVPTRWVPGPSAEVADQSITRCHSPSNKMFRRTICGH
jgi:hypothetical protein